ncbi:MAG TPA: DNA repair protein RecO [Candidatus Saccharimonadales bacterium]|nr:DNA repair protein RecO [Candidatus Saccharimonadales bacterium]
MKPLLTQGIVLSRTDYGEADRIITLLTPDHGKLRLMAKGVRKVKSKLAGGIELFSVSQITFLAGRGDMGTLMSTRLIKHYGKIVQDLSRVQLGYDLIRDLNRATEDQPGAEYFDLLEQCFTALDDSTVDLDLIRLWFSAQLLRLSGHTPNLVTDAAGSKLAADQKYTFDFDAMCFADTPPGQFAADHIKLLRLLFSETPPSALNQIAGLGPLLKNVSPLVQTMRTTQIQI